MIEADPANLNGDRKAAIDKLRNIRKRCLAGEDFAGYARDQNDLPGAAGDGGNGGHLTIKPNTFRLHRRWRPKSGKRPPDRSAT